jgi:hypothetical protein
VVFLLIAALAIGQDETVSIVQHRPLEELDALVSTNARTLVRRSRPSSLKDLFPTD